MPEDDTTAAPRVVDATGQPVSVPGASEPEEPTNGDQADGQDDSGDADGGADGGTDGGTDGSGGDGQDGEGDDAAGS